jgi:hypothetical protein
MPLKAPTYAEGINRWKEAPRAPRTRMLKRRQTGLPAAVKPSGACSRWSTIAVTHGLPPSRRFFSSFLLTPHPSPHRASQRAPANNGTFITPNHLDHAAPLLSIIPMLGAVMTTRSPRSAWTVSGGTLSQRNRALAKQIIELHNQHPKYLLAAIPSA